MKAKTVEEYIKFAPKDAQAKLQEMRKIIKSTVPDAEEKISYGMPYFGYKGRLAYFRLAKNHLGLYIAPPVIANYKKELEKYGTATATIRFPLNEKLPVALIKKLVLSRAKLNEGK